MKEGREPCTQPRNSPSRVPLLRRLQITTTGKAMRRTRSIPVQRRLSASLVLLLLGAAATLQACKESQTVCPTTPDTTAPSAVTDLVAEGSSDTAIVLRWTPVGDPCATNALGCGVAALEIRYSTNPITEQNFANAVTAPYQYAFPPEPSVYKLGVTTISGLTPGQRYYFALRAADYSGNLSALSNVATSVTWSSPPAVERNLVLGWPDENYYVSDFAVDSSQNIYLRAYNPRDDSAGQIWKYDASGELVDIWESPWSTWDARIEIDNMDNLYVPEWSQGRILEYSTAGVIAKTISCYPSDLGGPADLAVSGSELFIADRTNARVVQMINGACAHFMEVWSSSSYRLTPMTIAVDSSNHLYINKVWQTQFRPGVVVHPDVDNFADVNLAAEHVVDLVPDGDSVYMLFKSSISYWIEKVTSDGHLEWKLRNFYNGDQCVCALATDSAGRLYALHDDSILMFSQELQDGIP